MSDSVGWWAKAHHRLQTRCNKLFADWRQTKDGQRWWKASGGGRKAGVSPYRYGFSIPDYCHDIIAALGKNDEERVKGLILHHEMF